MPSLLVSTPVNSGDNLVKVFVVNPGVTATRMNDFQGMPPERVAEIILNTTKGKYKVASGGDVNVWDHI